jgi:hypothetical protein
MKITSSFRYQCPECNQEIEIQHVQDKNREYREEYGKNIEWLKIKGEEMIVAS